MEYELYIDIFFLENFMMDFFVLTAVKKVLHSKGSYLSICLGAVAGALLTSFLIVTPLPLAGKLALFHLMINVVMILIGLKIRNMCSFIYSFILLYIFSFLFGGVIDCIESVIKGFFKTSSFFFVIALGSYFIVRKGLDVLESIFKISEQYCEVTLFLENRSCKVQALIDSGNQLCDNLTRKPIHIISSKAIKKLIGNREIQKIRYVPYHTIQEKEGTLPIIRLDKMCIHDQSEKEILYPLVGITGRERFADGKFEMILNPKDC